MEQVKKRRYPFDPDKHSDPVAEYNLSKFYFVVHNGFLKLFKKHEEEEENA